MPHILIVDDEVDHCTVLQMSLQREGITSDCAYTVDQAIQKLATASFCAVLTDLNLQETQTGLDLVRHLVATYPQTPIAVMSAYGQDDITVQSMQLGAFDFIHKPLGTDKLKLFISKVVQASNSAPYKNEIKIQQSILDTLIGYSAPIMHLKSLITKVSRSQAPVFIQGESGTGKEVVANLIHKTSSRPDGPFIAINCGAIPPELMESELFGHKKGSFTGAGQDKVGLIQSADGGTLFLDEVAELPLALQVKLLRVLQEKKIRPIGADKEITVDFRVISATHQNIDEAVTAGCFRNDLYFRLHVMDIHVPPLRARGNDIILLAQHFCEKVCKTEGLDLKKLSNPVIDMLQSHPFIGNVRELINMLERACVFSEHTELSLTDFGMNPKYKLAVSSVTPDSIEFPPEGLELHLHNYEMNFIRQAMHQANSNQTKAAALLGISLRSLRYRLDKAETPVNS